ncbi:MAG: LPXTG cell wall anchor domain-containing protein, partial [Enterococcus devriesei]|uniref:LPXTG cell wall anchor domain-containing protein n=1 Tax=Enterococcus devriesei TaxID=319970 RepID=UPI003F8EF4CB
EAPKGFVKLKSEFIISISQKGEVKVSYEGADLDAKDLSVTQGQGEANSQIQFTARNDARMPLPKTGGDGLAATITLGLAAILIALWYHFPIKKRRDWHEESR